MPTGGRALIASQLITRDKADQYDGLVTRTVESLMADIVCLGEALIDLVPTVTGVGLAAADTFVKAAGGAPANVAAGVARLGVAAGFMGAVGDDGFGHFVADI